ncbi:hypothetical protein H6G41_34130 [Tolypothrix sp. FACHB-123]|uniref:P-loop NTPase fold protein n=1 Tax=Tolypothrix sp. FACHB-123 TaxID=2692868 RepID=UPI0016866F26|nr:P-loop NTPase fold protein [Tolypothrix sp. FACHB-123]MBD2359524.1 hypothetical protein [Tolypothrix sp. FACHB-123]
MAIKPKTKNLEDWFTNQISITVVRPDFFNVIPQCLNNDLAEGPDYLNIKHEVEALAEILVMNDLEPPLAVGIFGGWGSGKSHAMHLIQEKITQIRCQPLNEEQAWKDDALHVGHIYQIRFDAWTYTRSNLWASLMQTIFFELNRQLSLEKQLQKAGVSPLSGGQIWQALNEMSDEERQNLLEYQLEPKELKTWEKIVEGNEIQDLLLDYIKKSKHKEVEVLKNKEIALQEEKEKLEKLKEKIRVEVEPKNTQISYFFAPMNSLLKNAMGSALNELEKEVKDAIPSNRQLTQQDIDKIRSIFTYFRSNKLFTWIGIKKWILSNWNIFLWFGIFAILTILTPIILSRITKQLIPQIIATILPLIPTITTATVLFKKFLGWYASVEQSFKAYQKQIEEEQKEIAASQAKEIKEKFSQSKEIQEYENNIKQLESQIEQQKQSINVVNYVSLADFVTTQITTGQYEKRLGLLHQIKNDLAILTEKLTLPKQFGKRYQEKKKLLQGLFPRGKARVILYIDDLDRCPPKRVVEVLEAVQLLLKTPLFVVVLAIDDRYIARALEKVYEGVLKRGGKPSGIDYLEKIIQIPYRMRSISQSTIEYYLTSHMEIEEDENISKAQKKEKRKNAEKVAIESIEEKPSILEPKNNRFFSTCYAKLTIKMPV